MTLICHARTAAQKLARFPTNEPLEMDWKSAQGSRSRQFRTSSRILSAPELRARQTAALFGREIETVDALRDCDFGRWRGAQIDDLHKAEPEALQGWLEDPESAPHGGESVAALNHRVAAWLTSLEATPGHIVAVTHPFVIRAALTWVLQSAAFNQVDVEPLSIIELRFNGRWRFRLTGDVHEEPQP
nr:histidine phosphatase family protein [Pseudomonas violetae]